MRVFVDNEDKDFLDACLSECKVYEYVADELQYSDRLKLVSLTDYTKQVRKEVVEELKDKMLYCSERFADGCHYYNGKELDEIVDQIQGADDDK